MAGPSPHLWCHPHKPRRGRHGAPWACAVCNELLPPPECEHGVSVDVVCPTCHPPIPAPDREAAPRSAQEPDPPPTSCDHERQGRSAPPRRRRPRSVGADRLGGARGDLVAALADRISEAIVLELRRQRGEAPPPTRRPRPDSAIGRGLAHVQALGGEPVTPRGLAEAIGIDRQAAGVILRRLATAGHIRWLELGVYAARRAGR